MLTVFTGRSNSDCERFSRRDFLQVGSLSVAGLGLPALLEARAAAGDQDEDYVRDRSVVLLYLSGGASHIETFDPKMEAPDGVRSITGEVGTTIPGVTYGGTFPQLARNADKLAVVRSFAHPVGSHVEAHVHVLSGGTDPAGRQQAGFSMGSASARLRGANHPRSGIPTYCLLTEREIDGQYRNERGRVQKGSWPGSLGQSHGPFGHEVGWETEDGDRDQGKDRRRDENPLAADMRLNMTGEYLDDRMRLLRGIDRINRRIDSDGTMEAVDKYRAQAVSLLLGGAVDAFDFRREDPRLVERYDTRHIRIGHKVFRPSTLGKQMLVARRLCQAGCGFVTVHSAGWDMHADGNNPGMVKGMEMLGRSLDKAVSAFLEDVDRQGLSDKILLIITGDFGRTPKMNKRGGRDHWARLGTLAFAGGGLKMGQTVGQSTRKVDAPATEPITPAHLRATVMHALFDIGRLRLVSGLPRDLKSAVEGADPIAELA